MPPATPRPAIAGEPEQELPAVAAMREVPDLTVQVVTMRAGHGQTVSGPRFRGHKYAHRPSEYTLSHTLPHVADHFERSDPE
jgi:hypothetical protein